MSDTFLEILIAIGQKWPSLIEKRNMNSPTNCMMISDIRLLGYIVWVQTFRTINNQSYVCNLFLL
jgi:hypothetical protein